MVYKNVFDIKSLILINVADYTYISLAAAKS